MCIIDIIRPQVAYFTRKRQILIPLLYLMIFKAGHIALIAGRLENSRVQHPASLLCGEHRYIYIIIYIFYPLNSSTIANVPACIYGYQARQIFFMSRPIFSSTIITTRHSNKFLPTVDMKLD